METSPLGSATHQVAEISVDVLLMMNTSTSTPDLASSDLSLNLSLKHHQPYDGDNGVGGSRNVTFPHPATPPAARPYFRYPPDPFMETMRKVKYYGDPVLLTLGMVGNVLAYLVFTRSRFRKVPSMPYLSGIAVVDNGFVFTCFLTTLTYVFQVPIMSQMGVCQFGMFTNYVCLFLAMWYLVALVVEKFISVFWPLKKSSLCTVFRAKVVLVCLAVLAIVSYSYVIYFFGPNPRYRPALCGPWQEFQHPYQIFMVLDCIVVFIAPLLVIIVLVLLVVVRGCEYYYRMSSASDLGSRVGGVGVGSQGTPSTLRATELVYAVMGLVLITHVPNSVVRIAGFFNAHMDTEGRRVFMRCVSVVRHIHLLSFTVKFPLYWLVSRSFREHTLRLLGGGKERLLGVCDCDAAIEADPQRIILRGCGGGQWQQPAAGGNAYLLQSDV